MRREQQGVLLLLVVMDLHQVVVVVLLQVEMVDLLQVVAVDRLLLHLLHQMVVGVVLDPLLLLSRGVVAEVTHRVEQVLLRLLVDWGQELELGLELLILH